MVTALLAVSAGTAFGQVSMSVLSFIAGPSEARALSADGRIVAGTRSCGGFWWRLNSEWGTEQFSDIENSNCLTVRDISDDGFSVIGMLFSSGWSEGFRWNPQTGFEMLTSAPDQPFSQALKVSGDRATVVGSVTNGQQSYASAVWRGTGQWELASPGFDWLAVNGDGSTLAGVQQVSFSPPLAVAFRQRGQAIDFLDNLPSAQNVSPSDTSSDGSVVVGTSIITGSPVVSRATRWDASGDALNLGVLPGHFGATASAVSGDGGTIVGYSYTASSENYGFVWSQARGMRDLNSVANLAGTSVRIQVASAVSQDGCAIAGSTIIDGVSRAFVLRSIPLPVVSTPTVSACPSGVTIVAIDLDPSGFGSVQFRWERVEADGQVTLLADGQLASSVTVLSGTSSSELILIGADEVTASGTYRCRVWNSCGERLSAPIVVGLVGASPAPCDNLDFNNDCSAFDPLDIDDFLSVYSEGPCSTGACNDIDFNNDGSVFDPSDIDAFLSVYSEGPCL